MTDAPPPRAPVPGIAVWAVGLLLVSPIIAMGRGDDQIKTLCHDWRCQYHALWNRDRGEVAAIEPEGITIRMDYGPRFHAVAMIEPDGQPWRTDQGRTDQGRTDQGAPCWRIDPIGVDLDGAPSRMPWDMACIKPVTGTSFQLGKPTPRTGY